jgi:hypothetical protein
MAETLTIELYNRPTSSRVREALDYDPETGVFVWRISAGRVKPGTQAGVLKPAGYIVIQLDGRSYGAHRLAWLWMTSEWQVGEIDHINGSRADNRFANLRDVPRSMNQQNQRRAQSHNKSSAYLGVSWRSRSNRWRAMITLKGKCIDIGLFDTEELAHAAYVARKREIHAGCML